MIDDLIELIFYLSSLLKQLKKNKPYLIKKNYFRIPKN